MATETPSEGEKVAPVRNVDVTLDDVDRRLLALLRDNSRTSNRELARRVGLSAPACLRRVQRLERTGAIARYTVEFGRPAAGLSAFVGVRVGTHSKSSLREFERRIRQVPGAVAAFQVTGGFDYLVRVEVADLADYRRFHAEDLAAIPGVAQVTTFVVIEDLGIRPVPEA